MSDPRLLPTPVVGSPIVPGPPTMVDHVLAVLSDVVTADPHAATFLVESRCRCSPVLEAHPYIVVQGASDCPPKIGLLGVINGVLARAGESRIEAVFSDSEIPLVTGFRRQVKNLAEA